MDPTDLTHSQVVDFAEKKYEGLRNSLRPLDRKRLDRMFDCARRLGNAEELYTLPNKVEVMLICTMLEMMGRIEDLEAVTDKDWR